MKLYYVLEFVYVVILCLKLSNTIQCYFEYAYKMIFRLLRCFPKLTPKYPNGSFVPMRFKYIWPVKPGHRTSLSLSLSLSL